MEAKDFQALGGLTKEQRDALIEAVKGRASADSAVALIDTRFAAAPRCPHCRSVDVGTWSKPKPLTRYMCDDCGRTFTALRGTPLERLRRRDAWLEYAQCLADGISLRKAAKRCRIVLDTSFRWRHRFLELPKDKKATAIAGMVEVDETYFLKSQKGARKVTGRKARKRGGKASGGMGIGMLLDSGTEPMRAALFGDHVATLQTIDFIGHRREECRHQWGDLQSRRTEP